MERKVELYGKTWTLRKSHIDRWNSSPSCGGGGVNYYPIHDKEGASTTYYWTTIISTELKAASKSLHSGDSIDWF